MYLAAYTISTTGGMDLWLVPVLIFLAIGTTILGIATCISIISMSNSLRDLKNMYHDYHKAEYDKMIAEINEKATNALNQPQ